MLKKLSIAIIFFCVSTSFAKEPNWNMMVEDFNFKNADLQTVIEKVSQLTGRNFIVDPNVRGKVVIINARPITLKEAYSGFLAALGINGFSVVKVSGFFVIRSTRNAQRDAIKVYVDELPPKDYQLVTLVYSLKHASAADVAKSLRILPSKDGEITPFEPTNQIFISDMGTNLHRVWKVLKTLDTPQAKKYRRKKK